MALAADASGLHRADDAALVGADSGEALELTLDRLGHHDLLVGEDHPAAHGHVGRAGERAGLRRRRACGRCPAAPSSGVSLAFSSPPQAASTAGLMPTLAAIVRARRRSGRDVMAVMAGESPFVGAA